MIESWDLLKDDLLLLNKKLEIISYTNVKKQGLDKLWEKHNVLTANNMLKTILSEESIKLHQRRLKKATEVTVSPEDIVGAFRHLLNEAALSEMDKIRISLPAMQKLAKTSKATKSKATSIEQQVEAVLAEKHLNDKEKLEDKFIELRSSLYKVARIRGDVNAVKKGKVGKRVARRAAGKVTGHSLGKLFK